MKVYILNFLLAFLMLWLGILNISGQENIRGPKLVPTKQEEFKGNTYAIVIGISEYQNINSLTDADKDALAIYEFLTGNWGMSLSQTNVRLFLNKDAKNGDIMSNGFQWLEDKCKQGDRAIVYFAGHGVSIGNKESFLLPHDMDKDYSKADIQRKGGIQVSFFKRNYFMPMHEKGIQVWLILDACRNFDALNEKEGVTKFTSSTLDEYSGEIRLLSTVNEKPSYEGNPVWKGHGAFTFVLLKGLYGEADFDNNANISFNEIIRYLNRELPDITNGYQNPSFCCDENHSVVFNNLVQSNQLSIFQQKLQNKEKSSPLLAQKTRGNFRDIFVPIEHKALFDSFYVHLENNRFWGKNEADDLFGLIERLPENLTDLKKETLQNYCSALGNDIQNSINNFMNGNDIILESKLYNDENKILKRRIVWEKHFEGKTPSSARLYDLRLQYYPEHPYNELVEMKYYFTKAYSLKEKNEKEALRFIKKAIAIDSTQAYLYHVASLVSSGKESIEYNDRCLKLHPNFKYALNMRGCNFLDQKNYKEAENWFLKTIAVDSNYIHPIMNQGLNYMYQNKFVDAELWYRKAILKDSSYILTYNNLGINYIDQKKYEDAELCYRKAIAIDSSYLQAYRNLGLNFYEQKKYNEAEKWYKKAIQVDSTKANNYNSLGNNYNDQSQYDEAEKCYLKAIQIDSGFIYAYNNLGSVYKKQRQYSEAEKWYLKAIHLDSSFIYAYDNLGDVCIDQRQYADAEKWYLKAIQIDSSYVNAYNMLGVNFEDQGQYAEAEKWYRKAIQIDSEYVYAYYNLGNVYLAQGQNDLAEKWYLNAIDIDSSFVHAYYNLGFKFDNQKNYKEAEYWYGKAIKVDATYQKAYFDLSRIYKSQQKFNEAEQLWLKYLSIDSTKYDAYESLVDFYKSQEKYEEIEQLWLKYLRIDTTSYDAYYLLADFYKSQHKYQEAEEYWLKYLSVDSLYFDAYIGLADIYYCQQKYVEAEKLWYNYLNIDSVEIRAILRLGNVLEFQNRLDEAEFWYNKAITLINEDNLYYNLIYVSYYAKSRVFYLKGDYTKARTNLEETYFLFNSLYRYYNPVLYEYFNPVYEYLVFEKFKSNRKKANRQLKKACKSAEEFIDNEYLTEIEELSALLTQLFCSDNIEQEKINRIKTLIKNKAFSYDEIVKWIPILIDKKVSKHKAIKDALLETYPFIWFKGSE